MLLFIKDMVTRRIKLIALLLLLATGVYSQISSGGSPVFGQHLSEDVIQSTKKHNYSQTKAQLKSEESEVKGAPLKFAYKFIVNYTPDNSGTWTQLEDGTMVWRLLISSPGAYSINLIFDKFKVPPGAKLFIYNTDCSDVIGSFTEKNNNPSGILATAPVIGDQVIVEYQEPERVDFNAELLIGSVNHDYLGVHRFKTAPLKAGKFGDSGNCNEDISCYDVNNEMDVRRAVVKIIIDGTELCTGTMINSNQSDPNAYMITAAHCFRLDKTGHKTIAFFNYEVPHCSEVIEGTKYNTLSGGETKVYAEELDIALLEFYNDPLPQYRPYYAGWTLDSSPGKPFTSIHHPQGDVKKIATFNGDVQAVTFKDNGNYPYAQVNNFHWKVSRWSTGTTEGGSSGCPIFDVNKQLIGTLSGGAAKCASPINDYFTQFYKAWDERSSTNVHYKTWLDPQNTGIQSLEGRNLYENSLYERLSNIEMVDAPLSSSIQEGGYLAGHNAKPSTKYAERFSGFKSATLNGVYIMPSKNKYGSEQTIDVLVWQGNEKPENIIVKRKGVKIDTLRMNEEIYIEFDKQVEVEGDFFVGYELSYNNSPVDTLAVYYSSGAEKNKNTMYVYGEPDGWQMASELYEGDNYTLWLDVLAESVVRGDVQIEIEEIPVKIFPVPAKNGNLYVNANYQYLDRYEILSYSGVIVSSKILNIGGKGANKAEIELDGIPSGIYFLRLYLNDKKVTKKFVISRM